MCILDIRKPNIRLSFLNNRISNTNILNEKKKKKKKKRSALIEEMLERAQI